METVSILVCARRWLTFGLTTALAASTHAQTLADTNTPDFDDEFAIFDANPSPHDHPEHAVDISVIEPTLEPIQGTGSQHLGRGHASYYGKRFAGRPTASGELFDPKALTAAHRTLPFGSIVRVTNPRNGKKVVVRINDRGPFTKGRTIDLSRAAAKEIGLVRRGVGEVELELISN